jgi:hypothetical protein
MVKLKLKNSLAKVNYVKTLVLKGTCEVKELVDYETHKLNPQLINDLMNFLELEISNGKFSKEDFDKSKILQDIMINVFGELSESELQWLENHIQYILDNNLIKKNTFFLKSFKLLKSVIVSSKNPQN